MSSSSLFSSVHIGAMELQHRVVMAPMTRLRADPSHVPTELMATFYEQRASVPGTLLISEPSFVSPEAGGMNNVPGIWSEEQIQGWRRVTDKVHSKQCFIYAQIYAMGRMASPEVLNEEGGYDLVSSSDISRRDCPIAPRPLTRDEIAQYVRLFAKAAKNAIEAGFDGVELHAAYGQLIDQFTQEVCNKRTDEYGGTIENRARFVLEITKAVTDAIGEERTGIRFSPWSRSGGMRENEPVLTFSYVVQELHDRFPRLAYIHLVEPPAKSMALNSGVESNRFARDIWGQRAYIAAGGFQAETAKETADQAGGLVAFARWFISNPDLPRRLKLGASLKAYDTSTFYTPGSPEGYIDYPFLEEKGAAAERS